MDVKILKLTPLGMQVMHAFLFIKNNNKSIENNNSISIIKLKRREEYEKQNYNIKREDA